MEGEVRDAEDCLSILDSFPEPITMLVFHLTKELSYQTFLGVSRLTFDTYQGW